MRRSGMTMATTFVTIASLAVFAGACGSSSKSDAADTTTSTAPAAPPPLTITAGDYAFEGVPATIPAGIVDVTFVNKGQVDHEMAFLKVKPGTTPQAAFDALSKVFEGRPFPAFFLAANGVHDTKAGATTETQFNLTAGDYIALCADSGDAATKKDGKPHFGRGMYKTLKVTGTGGDEAPTADASITAHDYSFDLTGLKAGTQTIAFKNDSPVEWHFADINVFPKGVTVAQAEQSIPKLLASQGPPPAGVVPPDELVGSEVASPGWGNTFSTTLEAGRTYVVFCFISDLKGGPPHAVAHKMYKVFTVS